MIHAEGKTQEFFFNPTDSCM